MVGIVVAAQTEWARFKTQTPARSKINIVKGTRYMTKYIALGIERSNILMLRSERVPGELLLTFNAVRRRIGSGCTCHRCYSVGGAFLGQHLRESLNERMSVDSSRKVDMHACRSTGWVEGVLVRLSWTTASAHGVVAHHRYEHAGQSIAASHCRR